MPACRARLRASRVAIVRVIIIMVAATSSVAATDRNPSRAASVLATIRMATTVRATSRVLSMDSRKVATSPVRAAMVSLVRAATVSLVRAVMVSLVRVVTVSLVREATVSPVRAVSASVLPTIIPMRNIV